MNLFVHTGASAVSSALVTSASDLTAVSRLPELVLGDAEPLTVKFLSAANAFESWSGAADHVLSVSIGELGEGNHAHAQTSDFEAIADGWSGRLFLSTAALVAAVGRRPRGQNYAQLYLHIRVTDADGNPKSYAKRAINVGAAVSLANTPDSTPVNFATFANVQAEVADAEAASAAAALSAANAATSEAAALQYKNQAAAITGAGSGAWVNQALTGVASVTAPAATNLVLNGGSSGASLTLGQGGAGVATLNRALTISATTASTSSTTGALIVSGGAGIAGALYVGGGATVTGAVSASTGVAVNNATAATLTLNQTGTRSWSASAASGNLAIASGDLGGTVRITGTTASGTASTGALVVVGGVGVGGALSVAGNVVSGGTLRSDGSGARTSYVSTGGDSNLQIYHPTNGAVRFFNTGAGGLTFGIDSAGANAGVVTVANSTASTATTNGALIVTGGVGIGGALFTGGNLGGANQRAASFANTGGNAFVEITGSSKAAQLLTVGGTGELRIYTNATPGTIGTLAATFVSGGLLGTATNDSAAAGNVGEHVSSAVASGTPVSLSTGTTANVTSISLTAGDWDVTGQVGFVRTGTTTLTFLAAGVGTTSATLETNQHAVTVLGGITATVNPIMQAPTVRISLSATTTVYLAAQASFGVSTLQAFGQIRARRVR